MKYTFQGGTTLEAMADSTGGRTALNCTVLFCIVVYFSLLYRTVPYFTVLYRTVPYCTVMMLCDVLFSRKEPPCWLWSTSPEDLIHCTTVLNCTLLRCTLPCCTVLDCNVMFFFQGGTTLEAMVDFTGGCTEMFTLSQSPRNLFSILLKVSLSDN